MNIETGAIERRSGLNWDQFVEEYVRPNKPVILTDAAAQWEANKLFSPQFFKDNFPDKTATIKGKKYTVSEYVDLMLSGTEDNPAPYPFKIDIERNFTELLPLISPGFTVLSKNRLKNKLITKRLIPQASTLEVFMGGVSGWFPYIHYDLYGLYAIVTQVYGRKQFIVYDPEQAKYMYPETEDPWKSGIKDYYNPDYSKYPLFRNAKPVSDVVHPGETIFVPKGWWHTARSLEPTISIAQDLLTKYNWDIFERDVLFYKRKQGIVRGLAYAMYIKYAQAGIWFEETFTLRNPN
jgi:histone arginine demethylase JMJD6